ncbi:hypothetical protein AMTR_s00101p00075020 [Amborella trichopoda]|uniref:Uncharacterized protein n=1 Tax=Amborella trichopoda TaxID=13333 RepID=W1NUW3_AMBTC|nr:hypothetical protein AMTR_s00101p00075020 [Amborella trichopoda]
MNLSFTGINRLAEGMEKLFNLKYLNLRFTSNLESIEYGVISRLACLEELDMFGRGYRDRKAMEGEGGSTEACWEKFEGLGCLSSIDIRIGRSAPFFNKKPNDGRIIRS